MQAGSEEILKPGKDLIHIGNQLGFQASTLLHGFLAEAAKSFGTHQAKAIGRNKPEGSVHHKGFSNNKSVDFIGFRLADIVFAHIRRDDGVDNTHFVGRGNKVTDKVVAVVCVDSRPMMKLSLPRESSLEAISVIRELKRLNEYQSIRRNG